VAEPNEPVGHLDDDTIAFAEKIGATLDLLTAMDRELERRSDRRAGIREIKGGTVCGDAVAGFVEDEISWSTFRIMPRRARGPRPVRRSRSRTRRRVAPVRRRTRKAGSGDDPPGEPGEPAGGHRPATYTYGFGVPLPERPTVPPSLQAFHAATAHLTGPERLRLFLRLPSELQAAMWGDLSAYWRARRETSS